MNRNSEYIDIQTGQRGGTSYLSSALTTAVGAVSGAVSAVSGAITTAATTLTTDVQWIKCKSDNITTYLNLFADSNEQVKTEFINLLYNVFVLNKSGYKVESEKINNLNNNFDKLANLNKQINSYKKQYSNPFLKYHEIATSQSNNFNFTLDDSANPNTDQIDSGLEEYTKLCYLYQNYNSYIIYTNLKIEILLLIANDNNYSVKKKENLTQSTDIELKTSFENLRIGKLLPDDLIPLNGFLTKYKFLLMGLNDKNPIPDISIDFKLFNYLFDAANAFNDKFINPREKHDSDDYTLFDIFNIPINEYINKQIQLTKKNIDSYSDIIHLPKTHVALVAQIAGRTYQYNLTSNALTQLLSGSTNSNLDKFVSDFYLKLFEHNIEFKTGNNMYFYIWYLSQLYSDIIERYLTRQRFYNYVNVFRQNLVDKKETDRIITNLFTIANSTNEQVNEYFLYNKSLNNKFLKEMQIDYAKIDYGMLYKILEGIPDNYLDYDAMSKTIIEKFQIDKISLDKLKTDKLFKYEDLDKKILNLCVLGKISNKSLSGIKIFLYIYDCALSDEIIKSNEENFKLIHYYLTLNTHEKNESKLIKIGKLNKILTKLIDGSARQIDIELLKNIYLKKKILNPTLEVALTELIQNPTPDDQKYVYNLLLSLSPEKLEWNIGSLVISFITKTLGSYVKSFVGITEAPKLTLESIKKFIMEKQAQANPKWEDLGAFQIYSYFNFDCMIVNRSTLEKIIKELKSPSGISETTLRTLHIIINKNISFLEKIGKLQSPKLEYFIKNKLDKAIGNPTYSSQLYGLLLEIADQNIFLLNAIDFLKEKGITIENPEEDSTRMIIKMFEIYDHKKDDTINPIPKNLFDILNKLNNGELDDDDETFPNINILVNFIKNSPEYISEAQTIKIFFATNKNADLLNYDIQQELYQILNDLAKNSTLIQVIVEKATQTILVDPITNAVNTKLQATALDLGFREVPKDAIAKVKEIASTAQTIALTAGLGFATLGAYKAVDAFFGTESNSTQNSSLIKYEESSLKAKIQALVIGVGTTLTLQSAQTLFPSIMSIANDYIGLQSREEGLPFPSFVPSVIGGIIMGGLTMGLQGQLGMIGGGEPESNSKSLIERILDWIFASIDKLFGFNGAKPDHQVQSQTQTLVQSQTQAKSIESTYLYLTSQALGSDDVFNGLVINEHPKQEKIYQELKQKYNEFKSTHFEFNPYFKLNKLDSKRIKKLIAKIIALELNLFKGSNPYTFVNALSRFLGE